MCWVCGVQESPQKVKLGELETAWEEVRGLLSYLVYLHECMEDEVLSHGNSFIYFICSVRV